MVGTTSDTFLAHYGKLGMKWGRRKSYKNSVKISGSNRPAPHANLRPVSKDAKNADSFARVAKTQGTQALSNQQLQALVNRQNLERQYSQLNPKQLSTGQKFVQKALPGLLKTGFSAYQSMQPQKPKSIPTTELAVYTPPSGKRVAGQVLAAVGKQVVSQYGADIGMAVVKSLLK